MLDAEFLNGIFSNEETSVEDKVQSILSEYNADTRGLIQKRDQLLGQEKKLKEQIAGYEEEKTTNSTRIAELEDEIKKNSPEEHKRYYDAQLEALNKKHSDELSKVSAERDFFRSSHLKRLQNDAIEEGTKDIQFIEGLKNGFIATVMLQNDFEAKDIDGNMMFLNKQNKTIQDAMHDFALTPEGKAYIKNPTSGANSHNSGNPNTSSNAQNTITRAEYNDLVKNPQKFAEFRATHKNWSVVD